MISTPAESRYEVPAGARPSATVVLLRDSPAGPETLMLVRGEHGENDMRNGAAVFPGGVLDARDREAHALCVGGDDAGYSARFGLPAGGLDYAVAALRETFEEVGLLLACRPDGSAADIAALAADLHPWRAPLNRGEVGIAALCREFGLCLDLRGLLYTGHWLTPPGMPKRWDARFFTTRAPAGQQAVADGGEAQSLLWVRPQQALLAASGLKLLPAMRHTLGELVAHASAEAALQTLGARTSVPRHMPRRGRTAAGLRIVLPIELAYAEVGRLDPDGRGDALCELHAGTPVRLSANLWRLTAPNPGPMTGPGTNSYLVGAGNSWTVIDPGPADAGHVQALQDAAAAAGGRITRILVTHTHRDHSPGAALLAAATNAPVWGRVAAHLDWQDESFAPAHQPQHGEFIDCAPGVRLRVLHTPGHASNHLCYLLTEATGEGLLFTGDHVMQGSTVVINPPDGDMAAYLASLQALLDEPLHWLAPGHGFLVAEPHAVLRALIAHRLKREAKVAAVLAATAGASGPALIQALLPQVYDDVPAALHGVAQRSLLAHLLKLQHDGRALCEQGRWRALQAAS